MEEKYYGQQCQDEELNNKFRKLHEKIVNEIIAFCKENNIIVDELHLNADSLEESIKFGSWKSCTDSYFELNKYSDEWKAIITMKKIVDNKTYEEVKNKQKPFIYSI